MASNYSEYKAEDFARDMNVSRETVSSFEKWENLLNHWNKSINLVQKETIDVFWERHALDSYQLCKFIDNPDARCIDLGSGAGFPGLAIAIHLKGMGGLGRVDLVEANGKKCSFLRAVIRELELPARVLQERAEEITPQPYDIISARAFAPLVSLFGYAQPFWASETLGLFPKGRNYEQEDRLARDSFDYKAEVKPSASDPDGKIFIIKGLMSL